jgi:hypothetical protein
LLCSANIQFAQAFISERPSCYGRIVATGAPDDAARALISGHPADDQIVLDGMIRGKICRSSGTKPRPARPI